jgi:hypothetical protein
MDVQSTKQAKLTTTVFQLNVTELQLQALQIVCIPAKVCTAIYL